VAIGAWTPAKIGILLLDPSSPSSLFDNGGGAAVVQGVPVIVNSNSPTAMVTTGNGAISAPEFDVTGYPGYSGNGFTGTIDNNVPPTPDPLRYLPEPTPPNGIYSDPNGVHVSGNQSKHLQPGVYHGGIQVSGQASLTMDPGIYYMDGGG